MRALPCLEVAGEPPNGDSGSFRAVAPKVLPGRQKTPSESRFTSPGKFHNCSESSGDRWRAGDEGLLDNREERRPAPAR